MTRFDPRKYAGKSRVYVKIKGAHGIHRLYAWIADKEEYRPPETGKTYLARRWEVEGPAKVRKTRYFETLDEARAWANRVEPAPTPTPGPTPSGPTFQQVVADWKSLRYPGVSTGTREHYDKLLRLHFAWFMPLTMSELTPAAVTDWLKYMIANRDQYKKATVRTSFKQELRLLKNILNHYVEENDTSTFVFPVKRKHAKLAQLSHRVEAKPKNISEEELEQFLREARRGTEGVAICVMARVQFDHARRICEVAAIKWEHCLFDFADPRKSRIRFCQHMVWPRGKNSRAKMKVEPGLKNTIDVIEQPMMPKTFTALMRLWSAGAKGYVFQRQRGGGLFAYRDIQIRYNQALGRANLPYASTHIMRHGGSSKSYDESGSDLEVAAQRLGNTDIANVRRYAKRSSAALRDLTADEWDRVERETGRTGSQGKVTLEIVKSD